MKKLILVLSVLLITTGLKAATVSTTTPNTNTLQSLLIQKGESIRYSVTGTSTGTITLQKSYDGVNYDDTSVSVVGTGVVNLIGTVRENDRNAYYRFNVSTITAGSFVTEIKDQDDYVSHISGRRGLPLVQFYDQTIRLYRPLAMIESDRMALQSTYGLTQDDLNGGFVVITSTGGAITLTSTPTISTDTVNGTIVYLQSSAQTVTLQDNDTLSGSLLELGDTSRALGVGDILGLIYRDSAWYELFFADN